MVGMREHVCLCVCVCVCVGHKVDRSAMGNG